MFSLYANWKSNHTLSSMQKWVADFLGALEPGTVAALEAQILEVVIFPPSPLLVPLERLLADYPITVGAQDVSALPMGKHTGEVAATTLQGITSHVICGHSERRSRGESAADISQKIIATKTAKLSPILCISQVSEYDPAADIVAFEPLGSIGTGHIESLAEIKTFRDGLAPHLAHPIHFVYGGSVDIEHATTYVTSGLVDGFLIGGASLEGLNFAYLVNAVAAHLPPSSS